MKTVYRNWKQNLFDDNKVIFGSPSQSQNKLNPMRISKLKLKDFIQAMNSPSARSNSQEKASTNSRPYYLSPQPSGLLKGSIKSRILNRVKSSMLSARSGAFFGKSHTLNKVRPPSVFYSPELTLTSRAKDRPSSIEPNERLNLNSDLEISISKPCVQINRVNSSKACL